MFSFKREPDSQLYLKSVKRASHGTNLKNALTRATTTGLYGVSLYLVHFENGLKPFDSVYLHFINITANFLFQEKKNSDSSFLVSVAWLHTFSHFHSVITHMVVTQSHFVIHFF